MEFFSFFSFSFDFFFVFVKLLFWQLRKDIMPFVKKLFLIHDILMVDAIVFFGSCDACKLLADNIFFGSIDWCIAIFMYNFINFAY